MIVVLLDYPQGDSAVFLVHPSAGGTRILAAEPSETSKILHVDDVAENLSLALGVDVTHENVPPEALHDEWTYHDGLDWFMAKQLQQTSPS